VQILASAPTAHRLQRADELTELAHPAQDAVQADHRYNARFFDAERSAVYAITMGVGTILDARKLLLVASGKTKAKAVAQAVEGPVTSM